MITASTRNNPRKKPDESKQLRLVTQFPVLYWLCRGWEDPGASFERASTQQTSKSNDLDCRSNQSTDEFQKFIKDEKFELIEKLGRLFAKRQQNVPIPGRIIEKLDWNPSSKVNLAPERTAEI